MIILVCSEENKISHYIINKVEAEPVVCIDSTLPAVPPTSAKSRFKIGDNTFHDLPTLLTFYKHHYLDSTPLIRAATKKWEYVRAKFDFLGKDKEDLPFKKNEILTVISKNEEQWWTAKNSKGDIGQIPVPYVDLVSGLRERRLLFAIIFAYVPD